MTFIQAVAIVPHFFPKKKIFFDISFVNMVIICRLFLFFFEDQFAHNGDFDKSQIAVMGFKILTLFGPGGGGGGSIRPTAN